MNSRILNIVLIILIVLLLGLGFYLLTRPSVVPAPGQNSTGTSGQGQIEITGTVKNVAVIAEAITLDVNGKEMVASLTGSTLIQDQGGKALTLGNIKRSFVLDVKGTQTNDSTIASSLIKVTKQPNIIVDSPAPNDPVNHDFAITGEARVFESQFSWRVLDPNRTVLASGSAHANSPDVGQYGPFSISVRLPVSATYGTDHVTVEVYDESAKDGSIIDLVQIPLTLKDATAMTVKVFFGNSKLDPEASCNKVFPVDRIIQKTAAPAKAAINELLKGPTSAEKVKGYFTAIPAGSLLNSITIDSNGVAKADFNDKAESGGGSCSMAERTSEIRETLLQFPTVRSVEFSINGRTGDVFQP